MCDHVAEISRGLECLYVPVYFMSASLSSCVFAQLIVVLGFDHSFIPRPTFNSINMITCGTKPFLCRIQFVVRRGREKLRSNVIILL